MQGEETEGKPEPPRDEKPDSRDMDAGIRLIANGQSAGGSGSSPSIAGYLLKLLQGYVFVDSTGPTNFIPSARRMSALASTAQEDLFLFQGATYIIRSVSQVEDFKAFGKSPQQSHWSKC